LIVAYLLLGAAGLGCIWVFHAGSDYCGNEHREWHRAVASIYAHAIGAMILASMAICAYLFYLGYLKWSLV
jgi:hypothetical protein